MPSSVVKSFAKKTGKSVPEVEKLWDKAKAIAQGEGEKDNYALITGILKKMLKLDESDNQDSEVITSFREYLDKVNH